MKISIRRNGSLFAAVLGVFLASSAIADDGAKPMTIDHYVRVKSIAPAFAGQDAQIYVREVVLQSTAMRGGPGPNGVVLFVHGAGTPAEVTFDTRHEDFSWMAYLAEAGYDTFSMDVTGYGRSTRPPAMNDPCNLPKAAQAQFIPQLIKAPCAPSFPKAITNIASDWHDIGAVVDHLRALRGVDKVALIGWSQGGPRTAGYAARNPNKVSRLVVLAPAYNRAGPLEAPNPVPASEGPMTAQSRKEFADNWDRQVGCTGQYKPSTFAAVWSEMMASDPVGATWGTGVRRAPQVPTWGFNQAIVSKMTTPFLMVVGAYDKQVLPERVRDLYADLGSKQKVLVDLNCSSHMAMWEANHLLLFQASLEWLRDGTVMGKTEGELKMGYTGPLGY